MPRASAPSSCGPRSAGARGGRAASGSAASAGAGSRRRSRWRAGRCVRGRSGCTSAVPPRARPRAAQRTRSGRNGRASASAVVADAGAVQRAVRAQLRAELAQLPAAAAGRRRTARSSRGSPPASRPRPGRRASPSTRPPWPRASRTTARRSTWSRTARPGSRTIDGSTSTSSRESNVTQCGCERVCATTASAYGRSSKPRSSKNAVNVRWRSPTGRAFSASVREEVVDGADDRRRVDPAREARADGDVAAQPQAHRVEEELAHRVGRVAVHVARLELPSSGSRRSPRSSTTSECAGGSLRIPAKNVSSVWST